MRLKIHFCGAILVVGFGFCKAQVINIKGKRFLKDTNGFVGKADFNFNINQNTQKVLLLGANVHLQYKHNRHRLLAISDLSLIKAGDKDFVNSGYQHLRYSYKLNKYWAWESFIQTQYNKVLLLDRRYLAGMGPRFKVIKQPKVACFVACLYMYEYLSQNNDSIHRFNNRLSAYSTFHLDLNKVDFNTTVFYQPNMANLGDYRIAVDSALELDIIKQLYYKAGLNLLYDTRQPLRVPALTYLVRNGIGLKF